MSLNEPSFAVVLTDDKNEIVMITNLSLGELSLEVVLFIDARNEDGSEPIEIWDE